MYGFVKEKSENTHISSCEVLEIENKYNINPRLFTDQP